MDRNKKSKADSYLSHKAFSIKKEQSWVFGPPALQIQTLYLTIINSSTVLCLFFFLTSWPHQELKYPQITDSLESSRTLTVSVLLLQAVWKSTWPTSTSNKRTTPKPSSCTEWRWIRSSTLTRRWGSRSCRTSGWSSSAWANTPTLSHRSSTSWVRAPTLKQASTLFCATMPSATGRGWRRPFRNSSLFLWASMMKKSTSRLTWVQ